MKLIKLKTDLIKAIEFNKRLGFVPTMGSLHDGHKALIKKSKKNGQELLLTQIALLQAPHRLIHIHKHPHTDGDAHATTQLHYSLLLPHPWIHRLHWI